MLTLHFNSNNLISMIEKLTINTLEKWIMKEKPKLNFYLCRR